MVIVANKVELAMPKRTSFPSILPLATETPAACMCGLPAASAHQQASAPARNRAAIADLFIPLLFLSQRKEIDIAQELFFGDIMISLNQEEKETEKADSDE